MGYCRGFDILRGVIINIIKSSEHFLYNFKIYNNINFLIVDKNETKTVGVSRISLVTMATVTTVNNEMFELKKNKQILIATLAVADDGLVLVPIVMWESK